MNSPTPWLVIVLTVLSVACEPSESSVNGSEPATKTPSETTPSPGNDTTSEGSASVSLPSPAVLAAEETITGALRSAHVPDLMARARLMVGKALPTAEPTVKQLAAVAKAAFARDDTRAAAAAIRLLLKAQPVHKADFFVDIGEALIAGGEAATARELLIEGEKQYLDDPRFAPLIERAMDEDPAFIPAVRELIADKDIDAIKYLGGGSTITLRFIKDKEVIGAFKPKQDLRQSDFRAEIAAWRLCPIMRCGFDIPYNEHVKVEWRKFSGMYQRIRSSKQRAYREKMFKHLEYVREGEDDYVHGTLKAWVPGFTQFPVELTKVWQSWVTVGGADAELLAGPAAEGVTEIEWMHQRPEDFYDKLIGHLEGVSRGELARQISNMIVYDYMITNWDRFSGVPAFYGTNCQFKDGRIVSIDNGASFPTSPNDKVESRLQLVQRFSRQSIKAIRAMDKDKTLKRLFPEPSEYDVERFDHFWSQREKLLAYIDALIEEHGEAEVMFFP